MDLFETLDDSSSRIPLGLTRDGHRFFWDTSHNMSLVAVGGVATGKTSFLRTIMSHTALYTDWRAYILDGLQAAISELNFEDIPQVEKHVTGEQKALLDAIETVRLDVASRLAHGHTDKIMLLIDDVDIIVKRFDDDSLQKFLNHLLFILKYGRSTGVHVAMTLSVFPQDPTIVSVVTVPGLRIMLGDLSDDDRFILFDGFNDIPRKLPVVGRHVAKNNTHYTEYQGFTYHLCEAEVFLRAQK